MNEPAATVAAGVSPVGDRPTFEAFFEAHKQDVFAALWMVTRDAHEAEEVTQEAFVRILDRWGALADVEDLHAYAITTALNVWRSRHRRAAMRIKRVLHPSSARDAVADVDARDAPLRALAVLTPRERAAVVLTVLLDMTSDEAAKALGIRPSTVRVLANRGRARLREVMEVER